MKTAGGTINKHVIYRILLVLIKVDMRRYGGYLDFAVTKGWLQSLYSRMNMFRRMVTTSRPIVTSSLWEEVTAQFHNDIASAMLKYNIPDEFIQFIHLLRNPNFSFSIIPTTYCTPPSLNLNKFQERQIKKNVYTTPMI